MNRKPRRAIPVVEAAGLPLGVAARAGALCGARYEAWCPAGRVIELLIDFLLSSCVFALVERMADTHAHVVVEGAPAGNDHA